MDYEEARAIKIEITGIIQEWVESGGLEVSGAGAAKLAEEIFNQVKEHFASEEGEEIKVAEYERGLKDAHQKPTVTMTEIENAVGDTSNEYTKGVVELFESKGFEIGGQSMSIM